jgi:hypothetical protein
MGGFKKNGYPAADTDFGRLLDDLVAEDAHKWTKKQYWPHTMRSGVVTTDSGGRPAKITGWFSYYVPRDETSDVSLTFKAGVPECLYLDDDPKTCHAASPRMVSEYLNKKYAR